MAKEFLKQYEILLNKAKVDLHRAKILFNSFKNGDKELELEVIYFHFQQCAEKLLKALLDFNNIKFPHTHDIEDLIELINGKKINILLNTNNLEDLSEYAVDRRYSVLHDDLDDADKYIKILDELLEFVKKALK